MGNSPLDRRKARKGMTPVIFALLTALAIVIALVFWFSGENYPRQEIRKFDKAAWAEAVKTGDQCVRWEMWGDLKRNYLVRGAVRSEVESLLGPPEGYGVRENYTRHILREVDPKAVCTEYDLGQCEYAASGEKAVLCWDKEDKLIDADWYSWG